MVSPIFLRCVSGPMKGEVFELHSIYRYILGREPKSEEDGSIFIEISSENISRQHAEIFYEDDSWQIRDLESFNGIRIDKMKINEAYLQDKNVIDLAEFSFRVEFSSEQEVNEDPLAQDLDSKVNEENENTAPKPKESLREKKNIFGGLKRLLRKIDFRFKLLLIFLALGTISFFILKFSILIQIEKDLLRQNYRYSNQLAQTLGNRNREVLSLNEPFRLDCSLFRDDREVVSAVLWDRLGKQVCSEGQIKKADDLLALSMRDQEFYTTCSADLGMRNLETCSSVYPVKKWIEEDGKMMTVGFAQVDFFPQEAIQQVSNLNFLLNRVFFILMAFFIGAWSLVYLWMKRGLRSLEEDVHLLFTGATQKVESPEAFAAFEPLVQEVNRLFIKLNQDLSIEASGEAAEAGFLQDILQQIFMLEERAVLAIDHENQILAYSHFTSEVIPMVEMPLNLHISEAVADTHLQEELMRFLNDLSQSHEVLDRALSMSDRIVQAQGLPLHLRSEHIASIILF